MNLHIPAPCLQDWDNMVPDEKGKHCLACDKVVVDFTLMDTEQIKAYFRASQGQKTCGRFLSSQLAEHKERTSLSLATLPHRLSAFTTSSRFLRVGVVVLTSLLALVGCKQEIEGDKLMGEPSEILPLEPLKSIDSVDPHVKGKVKIESSKRI